MKIEYSMYLIEDVTIVWYLQIINKMSYDTHNHLHFEHNKYIHFFIIGTVY